MADSGFSTYTHPATQTGKSWAYDAFNKAYAAQSHPFVARPAGATKLVFAPTEIPARHSIHAFREHPVTVIWKNGKNLEEVSINAAIQRILDNQIKAWAWTQELLDAVLSPSPQHVSWRRAEERVEQGVWTEDLLPKAGQWFSVRLTGVDAPVVCHKQDGTHRVSWFNHNVAKGYQILPDLSGL